jgi:hypothetical protein
MGRKAISDKTRFLRGLFVLLAMLVAVTIVDYTSHGTLKIWLRHSVAPIALGGCIAFLGIYLTMQIKQRVLKMPANL